MGLLKNLMPRWWFSAHLHVRFDAVVAHKAAEAESALQHPSSSQNPDEIVISPEDNETGLQPDEQAPSTSLISSAVGAETSSAAVHGNNPDEIVLDEEEEQVVAALPLSAPHAETKFLALDKCLPKRQFLEVRWASMISFPSKYI